MTMTRNGTTDEDLMLRFRDTGDEGAFETLYARYADRIAAYIGRYVEDQETARDLAQEAFIKMAGSAGGYEPRARFSSWAYRIATNLAINAYKAGKRRGCLSLNEGWGRADDDEGLELMDTIPDSREGPVLEGIMVVETARDIRDAIASLPGSQRDAFTAVVVEGMSYADAATVNGCSVGTVKSRVHHARRSIKRMIEGVVSE